MSRERGHEAALARPPVGLSRRSRRPSRSIPLVADRLGEDGVEPQNTQTEITLRDDCPRRRCRYVRAQPRHREEPTS